MKYVSTSLLVAAMLMLTSSIVPGSPKQAPTAAADVQVIEVTAKKYEFNPAPIRVKQGARVQIRITATDHDHGFRIGAFPEGGERSEHAGLVFSSANECHKIERARRLRLSLWHKHRERTLSSAAFTADGITGQ